MSVSPVFTLLTLLVTLVAAIAGGVGGWTILRWLLGRRTPAEAQMPSLRSEVAARIRRSLEADR
jgi:hypothetical protein